jgi:peptide/nickel transport system substrate-binding protein
VGLRRPALVALGVVSALALGAADSVPGTAANREGTLRMIAGDVPTLDPALVSPDSLMWYLWSGACATLMSFRDAPAPAGYELRPEAAAGPPKVSADGRTYVFMVRGGLRFSDGSPLTAANFSLALKRVLNPAMRSYGAFLLADVKQVRAGAGGRLRIDLRQPGGDLPMRLALAFACPVPRGFPVDPAGVPLTGVGSGPYYVKSPEAGKELVFERNPYYRGRRPQRIEQLILTTSGTDGIRSVEEGRADVIAGFPLAVREALVQRYGIDKRQLFRVRGKYIYPLVLNTSSPLFRNNAPLRKAVNLALDRGEILRRGIGWRFSQTATDQILPSWLPGWADHRLYPLKGPDLPLARRLARGNLRGGKAVLYVLDNKSLSLPDRAEVIIRDLSRIGLEVTVKEMARDVLLARAGTAGELYDMLLTSYYVDYPDPANVTLRFLAGANARRRRGNTNYAYFDKPSYNGRMAAASRLTDVERLQAFSGLEADIMREEAPWAPLFEGSLWLLFSTRVGCFTVHPVYVLDYPALCVR